MHSALADPVSDDDLTARLTALTARIARSGLDAAVIAPGADLRYLAGASIGSHERLTALVVPASGAPRMLVPALERPGWAGSAAERLGLDFATWTDGSDPYAAAAALLPAGARVLGVDFHMPAVHALGLRAAVAGSELRLAGDAIAEERMRKSADEVACLAAVGAAIDRVHRRIGEWLRPGRTENEVARDIAAAIVAEGHERADFVIVGSGPNGASPHHEASDRVIGAGEPVVIDIGGPAPSGYYSDSTRTYVTGGAPVPDDARVVYEVVRRAQAAAIDAVRPGVSAESVDAAARRIIEEAGFGEYFITRTGHGIGLEVHEEPYIVAGNTRVLEPGMAFSIEPGIYLPDRFGVRIEDIVVVGESGARALNTASKELTVVGSAS